MSTLERAVALATAAHSGVVDKGGRPYILHPLRVMLCMATDEQRIVAMLHDVIEDTPISIEDLRRLGFSEAILHALEAVTKRPDEEGSDEAYFRFVRRAIANPIARSVKRADIEDNMDYSRISEPGERDHARMERYRQALEIVRREYPDD